MWSVQNHVGVNIWLEHTLLELSTLGPNCLKLNISNQTKGKRQELSGGLKILQSFERHLQTGTRLTSKVNVRADVSTDKAKSCDWEQQTNKTQKIKWVENREENKTTASNKTKGQREERRQKLFTPGRRSDMKWYRKCKSALAEIKKEHHQYGLDAVISKGFLPAILGFLKVCYVV